MMRAKSEKTPAATGRAILIALLYALSVAIILLGAWFCVTSMVSGVRLAVLASSIPGAVFGLVILFLGVRYFLSLSRLRKEVFASSGFSWSNFGTHRKSKAR